jgi:hypothetical protein
MRTNLSNVRKPRLSIALDESLQLLDIRAVPVFDERCLQDTAGILHWQRQQDGVLTLFNTMVQNDAFKLIHVNDSEW